MPELRGGARGPRGQASAGLVVPLAVRLDWPSQVASPIGLELRALRKLGVPRDSAQASIYHTLAVGQLKQGNIKEAEAAARAALRLDGTLAEAWWTLGVICRERRDAGEAIAALSQALKLAPDDAQLRRVLHADLGRTFLVHGQWKESLSAYRSAADGAPDDQQLRDEVRRAELRLRLSQELPEFSSGHRQPADTAERLQLAIVCGAQRQHPAALRHWEAIFARDLPIARSLLLWGVDVALRSAGSASEEEAARCRGLALTWLTAARTELPASLGRDPATNYAVRRAVRRWHYDPRLASIRGPKALAALPEAERGAWERFWKDADDLLAEALR